MLYMTITRPLGELRVGTCIMMPVPRILLRSEAQAPDTVSEMALLNRYLPICESNNSLLFVS